MIQKVALYLCSILFMYGCADISGLDQKLRGSWMLDKSTSASGKYDVEEGSKEITFLADGYFIMEVNGDYMDGEFGGQFYLNKNGKRHWQTLTLIPNTYIDDADTINLECESYDVISIGDSVLILQHYTEFISLGQSKAIVFNQRHRYLRSD